MVGLRACQKVLARALSLNAIPPPIGLVRRTKSLPISSVDVPTYLSLTVLLMWPLIIWHPNQQQRIFLPAAEGHVDAATFLMVEPLLQT